MIQLQLLPMSTWLALAVSALACELSIAQAQTTPSPPAMEARWFYAAQNLQVEANARELVQLIERAAKAGYNGVVLADYKLNVLDRVPDHYFRNASLVKDAAARHKIEIIPCVFPIGYSAGLLAHDPNLAEGVPVKNAPFLVKGAKASIVVDPTHTVRNGGFEQTRRPDTFTGFSSQDDPGITTFQDREVRHGGDASCRMTDPAEGNSSGNCRLIQRVPVRPWTAYKFSAWVKTKDLNPSGFRLLVMGTKPEGRALTFTEFRVEPTQDWTGLDVVFNSLESSEVLIYAGQWGGKSGTLWLDDLTVETLGLVNVLRRTGCPITVTNEDATITYEEGRDYQPIVDPKLGQVPYAGEYSYQHDGPPIEIKSGGRIQDGQKLLVSWYHPILVHGEQVACCLSEPKVEAILRDQARRVKQLFEPRTYFMSHDELRVANWCQACQSRDTTAGRLLAENARKCVTILKELDPAANMVVWSDMFDPNHNAVANYYLVNKSLEGSWEGLPPQVIIANWNGGKAASSLRFFAERGHSQVLAGYYDEPGLSNYQRWWQAVQQTRVSGVKGFMYTTWQRNYRDLEAHGKAMTTARPAQP